MYSNNMFLLPMRDKVLVTKQSDNPVLDEWGVPVYEEVTKEYKCTIIYNTKLEEMAVSQGKTIVYYAKIYLRGLVNLEGSDKIKYIDPNGDAIEKDILAVRPIRDFGGKVLATYVVI